MNFKGLLSEPNHHKEVFLENLLVAKMKKTLKMRKTASSFKKDFTQNVKTLFEIVKSKMKI